MKFNCGPTRQVRQYNRRRTKTKWHKKFLFLPKRLSLNGEETCRWLEFCWRRNASYFWDEGRTWWEHKPKEFVIPEDQL